MKKAKIIVPIVIGAILTMAVVVALIANAFVVPKTAVDVSGNIVDNDYNNYLTSGNLVRIDDKLYYNYEKNDFCHGLIEISSEGSKRIDWDGVTILQTDHKTHPIRKYDGKLLSHKHYDKNTITIFNFKTEKFEENESLNSIPESRLEFFKTDKGIVYITYDIHSADNDMAIYANSKQSILADDSVSGFAVVGDDIYYSQSHIDEGVWSDKIKKYNLIDESYTEICDLSVYLPSNIFVENNILIFDSYYADNQNGLYKIDLDFPNEVETVYLGDSMKRYNVFENKIYIATEKGVICHDLETNESISLCDKYAEECYLVDDKWVYFKGKRSSLWRVAQDGSIVEKVYG